MGLLHTGSPQDPYALALRRDLSDLGTVEGWRLFVEPRYAEGRIDSLPTLASELVALRVDVIVAVSTPAALAAKGATPTIPIVMTYVGDPVLAGLVPSLSRPGGNITGVSALNVEYSVKWLELLNEAVPRLSRVAVLRRPANPNHALLWQALEGASRSIGVTLRAVDVGEGGEFERAFSAMVRERVRGLVVLPDPLFTRKTVAELATRSRIPAIYQWSEFVETGGLMAYGPSLDDLSQRTAYYVGRILKGTRASGLPVEQPTKFELVVNLKAAKALGLSLPQSLLARAGRVIE